MMQLALGLDRTTRNRGAHRALASRTLRMSGARNPWINLPASAPYVVRE